MLLSATGCDAYVQRKMSAGDADYKALRFAEAAESYRRASVLEPDNPRILRQLGLAEFRAGDLKDAFAYLLKYEDFHPEDDDIRLVLGAIYIADRRADGAIRSALRVLAAHQTNAEALTLLGSAYLNRGKPVLAAETYERLLRLNEANATSHYLLGVALDAQGETAAATRELTRALELEPVHAEAAAKLVEVTLRSGRAEEALAMAQRLVAAAPQSAGFANLLGVVQTARGDAASAERAFRDASRLDPRLMDARIALANLYGSTGRLPLALTTIDAAIKIDTSNAGAYTVRGMILAQQGNIATAQQAFEEALAINPRFATAANNLAWLLSEKLDSPTLALPYAKTAATEAPDDPHIADTYGWILAKSGEVDEAVKVLKGSAAQLPGDATIQLHLGTALTWAGNKAAAAEAFRRAAASPVDSPARSAAREALDTLR